MNYYKVKFLKDSQPQGRPYTYAFNGELFAGDKVELPNGKHGVVDGVAGMEEVEQFGMDKIKEIVGKCLERKVYSSYAFKEDECEKSRINHEIYGELKEKWRIIDSKESYNPVTKCHEPINFDDYDLVYVRKAGYAHGEYTILKNATDLSDNELALIFDGGNLCFGYTKERENFFYIFED